MVFINGKKYYLWLAIESETRFVVAFHLIQSRDFDAAFTLMNQAKSMGKHKNFITDRLLSYHEAVKTVLNKSNHISVPPMSSDINNNLIESFNKTFKACYKAKKGFNYFEKANNLIYMFIFHYNFIRPHGSLNSSTPSEVAGFSTTYSNKHNWFIAA